MTVAQRCGRSARGCLRQRRLQRACVSTNGRCRPSPPAPQPRPQRAARPLCSCTYPAQSGDCPSSGLFLRLRRPSLPTPALLHPADSAVSRRSLRTDRAAASLSALNPPPTSHWASRGCQWRREDLRRNLRKRHPGYVRQHTEKTPGVYRNPTPLARGVRRQPRCSNAFARVGAARLVQVLVRGAPPLHVSGEHGRRRRCGTAQRPLNPVSLSDVSPPASGRSQPARPKIEKTATDATAYWIGGWYYYIVQYGYICMFGLCVCDRFGTPPKRFRAVIPASLPH